MLRAHLSSKSYYSSEHFEKEQNNLFGRSWEFACFLSDLPNLNDFKVIRRGGCELILQMTREGLRAFRNSCPHRFAQIHTSESGNRPLICPYHGWTFTGEGKLAGLPGKETFDSPEQLRKELCLKTFPLKIFGELVFVRVIPGISSEEFFGDQLEFLENVGSALSKRIDHFAKDVDVNWKILIENSLEGYHVPMVHPETLGQFQGMSKSKDDIEDVLPGEETFSTLMREQSLRSFPGAVHSHMLNKAEQNWLERFGKISSKTASWPLQLNGYVHHLLFPNLTITSFLGYSFHIQHFEAIGPEKTRIQGAIYSSRFDVKSEVARAALFEPMFRENIEFTHQVFGEDEGITKAVQAGVKTMDATERSVFSSLERRIWAFQQSIRVMEHISNGT